MNLKAIDTIYKGHRFRSRLEARTAIYLDELDIPWVYEEEGFVLEDGTPYLPDFYLPQQDAFLEVKGVMLHKDMNKIIGLWKASMKCVFVMDSNMNLRMFDSAKRIIFDDDAENFVSIKERMNSYLNYYPQGEEIQMCRCAYCGGVTPIGEGWYKCLCCGGWDGDHHLVGMHIESANAKIRAMQARFEYDERKN